MEEIKIEFETITPIWTGDAWGENRELKASSIMGSLRFWFEVYCYFAGIEVKEKEELNYKEFIGKRKEILKKKDFEILKEMGIGLSSQIFGCTGWKSRIEIREIIFKQNKNYSYPIGKKSFSNLKYIKEFYNKRTKKTEQKEITPSWFFPKGFYGIGSIVFKTTEQIKDSILLPLLNFIEQYAFIGAKNNIGYGRVQFRNLKRIDAFNFNGEHTKVNSIFEEVEDEVFWEEDKIVLIDNFITKHNNLKGLIEELLIEKANIRQEVEDQEDRHYKFGTVRKAKWEKIEVPQATKIIPLISKNSNNSYSGRFLSIVGIKNFGDEK